MADINEINQFDQGIYQIETSDPVLGGADGIANVQAKALANRTLNLKTRVEVLETAATGLATQTWVNDRLDQLPFKLPVRAATTANLASLSGLLTIDGIVLAAGDRVLVKDQVTGSQNGIYVAGASAWLRATDLNENDEIPASFQVPVAEGALQGNTFWFLTNNAGAQIGTTALVFSSIVTTPALTVATAQATETSRGTAEIATQAETEAGTDDERIVTPKKLRFGFSISLTANGYIVFPSWLGGFIIQWGAANVVSGTATVVTFPIAFTSACRSVSLAAGSSSATADRYVAINASPTTNQLSMVSSGASATTRWIAIGN